MATVLDQFNMHLGMQLAIGATRTVHGLRFGIWKDRHDDWKLPLELEKATQPTVGSPELRVCEQPLGWSSMVETTLNCKPKALRYHVPILCIDPFTGDTNMWANYQTEPWAVIEVGQ